MQMKIVEILQAAKALSRAVPRDSGAMIVAFDVLRLGADWPG